MTAKTPHASDDLIETWLLPYTARLGSSVRSKGIFMEVRSKLPASSRKALTVAAGELTLRMPAGSEPEFSRASGTVAKTLETIAERPVIPREIEDILGITSTERHRWLKDGRLPSLGTRTVKLRGRARKVVFHVFEPRMVEALLDSGMVDEWRVQDAEAAAENRRRGAWKAKLNRTVRSPRDVPEAPDREAADEERFKLRGWAEFEREGPK
jgi:hypothetical protein